VSSRLTYDETALEQLAASVREHGVLQPILVRPLEPGNGSSWLSPNGHNGTHGYVLVAGNRRLEAAKRAGLQTIPALVRITGGDQPFVLNIVENIQRENLSGRERVRAITLLANLREAGGEPMSTRRIATLVKKDHTTIAKWLGIHRRPALRDAVADGSLKIGHAMKLVAAPPETLPELIAAAHNLSQPELQRMVAQLRKSPGARAQRRAEANRRRALGALDNLSRIVPFEPLDPTLRSTLEEVITRSQHLLGR
jgi:ParB family chromosome partitioning protein